VYLNQLGPIITYKSVFIDWGPEFVRKGLTNSMDFTQNNKVCSVGISKF